jgi:hypothetical protein
VRGLLIQGRFLARMDALQHQRPSQAKGAYPKPDAARFQFFR